MERKGAEVTRYICSAYGYGGLRAPIEVIIVRAYIHTTILVSDMHDIAEVERR